MQAKHIALDEWLTSHPPLWLRYGTAVLAVGVGMLLDQADLLSGDFRIYLVFYPFIIIATLFGGLGPGLVSVALSGVAAAFFLVARVGRLVIASRADAVSMSIFILGSVLIVWVCERLRTALTRAAQAEALNENSAEIARKTQLLADLEQRLSMAQKAGEVGMFDWDIPDDKIVWTPEQEALFGMDAGGFKGTYADWAKRIHPEDEPRVALLFQEWLQSGPEKQCWEYRILSSHGETRWIAACGALSRDPNGEPKRMIGTNRDITEKKTAEEILRESERRCWSLFETVEDSLFIIDESGGIENINPAAAKLLGYRTGEIRGQNVRKIIPSLKLDSPSEWKQSGQTELDLTAIRKDGASIAVRVVISQMLVGGKRMFAGQIRLIH